MKTSAKPVRPHRPVVTVAAPPKSNMWLYVWGAMAATVLIFIVYGPALGGPFMLDDTYLPYMQSEFATAPLIGWLRTVRPMLMLTYWMNFQESGVSPGSYHVVNLILHLFNGALIFLCVRNLLSWAEASRAEDRLRRDLLAGFAAGLFLLHPVQTESVSYVASRSETLSVFFFLASFTVFLYRKHATASIMTAVCVLLLFGAAVLSKEHAAVLPALLLLTDYYWNPGFSFQGIRRNWRVYVPIVIAGAAGLAFVWRILKTSTSAGFGMRDLTWYQYFFTECRVIWRYVWLYIFPFGQNLDPDVPLSHNVLDHGAIIGLAGILAVIAAAWVFRKRYPLQSYGAIVFLLLLAPTSSFVPIRDTLAERRMYLPFIGLLLVTVGLLRHWKATRFTLAATLGAVLFVEGVLAFQRNELWSDPIAMWSDTVSKSPQKFRPRFQLAYAEYNSGRCADAVNEFAKTAQLSDKPDYGLLVDWALSYDCAGNPSASIEKLTEAAALEPSAHVYSQIGMEYAKEGKYPQALDALEKAERLDANWEMTYVYRGNIFLLEGNKPRAAEEFRRALSIDPQNATARDGLAKAADANGAR